MSENSKLQLREKITDLLSNQKLAVLATRGKKQPHGSLVAFAYSKDLQFIIFATAKDTIKYDNIQKYPLISLLVDNRKNNLKNFEDAVALTIIAKGETVGKQPFSELYLARFPDLREFLEDPRTALILLKVQKYIYVQRFNEIQNLKI
ncbi:MAG: pyridoxamine 5'-phosphate oxidase family protein [Atribacterota bacterium]|nr:pyridoxamine 5'-phosphate oxidase family protein [Atribacterota bacterium]